LSGGGPAQHLFRSGRQMPRIAYKCREYYHRSTVHSTVPSLASGGNRGDAHCIMTLRHSHTSKLRKFSNERLVHRRYSPGIDIRRVYLQGISDNIAPLSRRTHKLVVDDGWGPFIRQKRARVYLDNLWKNSESYDTKILTSIPKDPTPAYKCRQAVTMRRAVRDPLKDSGAVGFLHFHTMISSQRSSFHRCPVIVSGCPMPHEVHAD
jgi:hypothetical protein